MKFIVVRFEIVKRNSPHIWFISGWWFGTWMDYFSHHIGIYWECHPPKWLSVHHFLEGWLAQRPSRFWFWRLVTWWKPGGDPGDWSSHWTIQVRHQSISPMWVSISMLNKCDMEIWGFLEKYKRDGFETKEETKERYRFDKFDIADMVWWRWKPTGFVTPEGFGRRMMSWEAKGLRWRKTSWAKGEPGMVSTGFDTWKRQPSDNHSVGTVGTVGTVGV